jgi:RNase P subunit RPR2
MGAMTALAVIKAVTKHSKKVMPAIKAMACKECYTLASVTVHNGRITLVRCACVGGR